MAIESVSINNVIALNEKWPLADDLIKEGDDHIRLVKATLKRQFPGFNKPLSATSDQLNNLFTAIAPQANNLVIPAGKTLTVAGTLITNSGSVFNMNGQQITGLGNPTAATNAVTLGHYNTNTYILRGNLGDATNGKDLDTLHGAGNVGIWNQAMSAAATAAKHYPTVNLAGTLFTIPGANGAGTTQMYVNYDGTGIFVRGGKDSSTAFGSWIQIGSRLSQDLGVYKASPLIGLHATADNQASAVVGYSVSDAIKWRIGKLGGGSNIMFEATGIGTLSFKAPESAGDKRAAFESGGHSITFGGLNSSSVADPNNYYGAAAGGNHQFNGSIDVSGGATLRAPLNMNGQRVVGVADPTDAHDAATKAYVDAFKTQVFNVLYPVGAIYITTAASTPAQLGMPGTWGKVGAGQCLIGADGPAGTIQATGANAVHAGRVSVALGINELPTHNHTGGSHTHTIPNHAHPVVMAVSLDAAANHTHGVSGTAAGGGAHSHGFVYQGGSNSGKAAYMVNSVHAANSEGPDVISGWTSESGTMGGWSIRYSVRIAGTGNHTHGVSGTAAAGGGHNHGVHYSARVDSSGGGGATSGPSAHSTGNNGSGHSFDITPPAYSVYVWRRSA